jgi:plasmid stabilization system protein ParE
LRCFSVGNYVIFFRARNPVEILRILHGAMDASRLTFTDE